MAPTKRKNISLEVKRQVIQKKDGGMGNSVIGRVMGLSESTVRTIIKNRESILKCIDAYGSSAIDNRRKTRECTELVKTERYLALWINRKESEGFGSVCNSIFPISYSYSIARNANSADNLPHIILALFKTLLYN